MLTAPTPEQIRTLAPDGAAARAAEEIGTPRRWSATGRTGSAAWGLCKGSGANPYQVAVDLGGPAYRCSCPSRKVPCKHALGMLFLLAGDGVAAGDPPDWVASWLESRTARSAAAVARAEQARDVDPAGQARRVESREKKIGRGIEELDRWLGDLMRRGLDSTRGEGYRFWDSMGARLVDAQAPGLARSVRGLGGAANAGDQWPHLLLEGAARLHLLCEAYRRADALPDALRADVRSLVGWTTKEDDLDPAQAVTDRWLVVGRRVDDTGQIMTARTWLIGEASGRMALHLAFGVDAAPPTLLALPGTAFTAMLAFYPSATPLRASVRPVIVPDGEVAALPHGSGIADMLVAHGQRLATNPFLDSWPVVLQDVVPVVRDGSLLVRDVDGAALPVVPVSTSPRMLAVSGGRPFTFAAEWDGAVLRPLAAFAEGRLVDLPAFAEGPRVPVDGHGAWSLLVSAALLGTERSGDMALPADAAGEIVAAAPSGDPERRLLATAGIAAVRRRAGTRPRSDTGPIPEPAPNDPRPAVFGIAARLLVAVLIDTPALLDEYLALTRASGRRLPDERLPELLTIAVNHPGRRAAILEVGGSRATWLVAAVPALRAALGAGPPDQAGPAVAWEEGADGPQRAALVAALRERDPDEGRRFLEARLSTMPDDDRAEIMAALATGLGPADEPFLGLALADRRSDVRRLAADLLARLPGSAFARRVAEIARPLLAPHGRLRPNLAVTLPEKTDELEALGFGGRTPAGLGERAWLLRQIVGHVPPGRWTEWLVVDPTWLVERALRADEERPLLEGWIEATARFGDAAWAAALLREPRVAAVAEGTDIADVLERLAAPDRDSVLATVAEHLEPAVLARVVKQSPPPWSKALTRAVFAVLARSVGVQYPDQSFYELVRAAALGVPADRAEDLATLAAYQDQLRGAVAGAVDTIRLRRELQAAFAALPPV